MPEWAPFCTERGVAHEDLHILATKYCPYCGAQKLSVNDGKPVHYQVDDTEPSGIIVPAKQPLRVSSQTQASVHIDKLAPGPKASARARDRIEAVEKRNQLIAQRPSYQAARQAKATSSLSHPTSSSAKMSFGISMWSVTWHQNEITGEWSSDTNNINGISMYFPLVLILASNVLYRCRDLC